MSLETRNDKLPNAPESERLIGLWQKRDKAMRTIELAVVGIVLLFNIFLLYQIRTTQKDNRAATAAAAQAQQELLQEAKDNSARDHQETIRYLRCLALLQPPYVGTAAQHDGCIASSKLPDDKQNPPILNNGNSGASDAGSSQSSTNPKAEMPAASAPATNQPAPQQSGVDAILNPIGKSLDKVLGTLGL